MDDYKLETSALSRKGEMTGKMYKLIRQEKLSKVFSDNKKAYAEARKLYTIVQTWKAKYFRLQEAHTKLSQKYWEQRRFINSKESEGEDK